MKVSLKPATTDATNLRDVLASIGDFQVKVRLPSLTGLPLSVTVVT